MRTSKFAPFLIGGALLLSGCASDSDSDSNGADDSNPDRVVDEVTESSPGDSNPESVDALNLANTVWRSTCFFVAESDPANPDVGTYQEFEVSYNEDASEEHVIARIYNVSNDVCVGLEDYKFESDYAIVIGDEIITTGGHIAYQITSALIDESVEDIWEEAESYIIYRDGVLMYSGQDEEEGGNPNTLDFEKPFMLIREG